MQRKILLHNRIIFFYQFNVFFSFCFKQSLNLVRDEVTLGRPRALVWYIANQTLFVVCNALDINIRHFLLCVLGVLVSLIWIESPFISIIVFIANVYRFAFREPNVSPLKLWRISCFASISEWNFGFYFRNFCGKLEIKFLSKAEFVCIN